MNSNRKIAIVTGVLFIIGTVAGICSCFLVPILQSEDYLLKISANQNQVIIGGLFQLIAAFACTGIAISLYPVLKKYNEGLALGAVGFRIIEGVLGIVGVICLILLLTLSQEFVKAGTSDLSYFKTLGILLLAGRDWVANVARLLAWCLGALMYYYIFYQSKLIPRWLSGWGLIGVTLAIVSSILVMLHLISPMSTIQVIFNIPIALQEMVLAVWLIIKGFNPSAFAALNARQI